MRPLLALLLCLGAPLHAETTDDPLWTLFTSYAVARDEKAVNATYEGKEDTGRLASLQGDLQLLAGGFESFRDESQVKENLVKLEPRVTPELRPFFKDRSTSLETIYRTLAVTDYTWALRFPSPPCSPAQARRALLESRDGLFENAQGVSSPWLASLLGPQASGRSAERALDRASAKTKLSPVEYEKRRAMVRKLTLALASDKAVGEARSKLYCQRASAYEALAASQGPSASAPTLASRSAPRVSPEPSVFVVVSGTRRAAATMIETKFGPVLVTDAAITAGDDHPRVYAEKSVELAATVARRDETVGLATLTLAETSPRPALPLAAQAPAKDELVTALGHAEASGLWTKTSGLVTKSGPESFQTDAAVSADFSGGPVLNDAGEVAGLLVQRPADTEEGRWPVAVPARKIALWLEGAQVSPGPPSEAIEDAGTAAVLSRTRPDRLWNAAYVPDPPAGNIVCMKYCDSGSSRGSSSSYAPNNGSSELGQALGQLAIVGISALFRGIGKLFSGNSSAAPKSAPALTDNRHHQAPAQPKESPKAPDPLKPSSLSLAVSRTVLAQDQEVEATATVNFTGTEGSRAGLAVAFTVVPGGKLNCPSGRTDAGGIARVTCVAPFNEQDRRFDGLQDETRRRLGMKAPERVRRKPAKGDKVAELKERTEDAQTKLLIEEEKPRIDGTDTPGLDIKIPNDAPEEYVVKGDRVTLSANIDRYLDRVNLDILERPCFAGSAPAQIGEVGPPSRYRCRNNGTAVTPGLGSSGMDRVEAPSEDSPPDENVGKPKVESRPDDAPTGTKPIDRTGLTRPEIHEIKKRLRAGSKAWVGISPDGDVITTDGSGQSINNGPWENLTHPEK